MREGRRDPLGGLFVGGASVLFAGTVILGDVATRRGLPVTSMLAVRFAVAAAVLASVQALARRPLAPHRGEGRALVVLGAVGYAVESALFFLAIGRGTAAAATLLFFTYPVLVALLSAILGRGLPGWLVGGSLAAAVSGAAIVIASSGGLDITGSGIAFALGAALTFSVYLLGVDVLISRTSPLATAMWISASSSGALAVYAFASGGRLPRGVAEWVPVAGMGLLTAGAFLLLFLGLRRIGPVRTSIIAAGEPVATAVLAVVFLDEPLRAGLVGGGALIVAGAVAASLARRVPEPQASVP